MVKHSALSFSVPSDDQDQSDFNPLPRAVRDDVDRTLIALCEIAGGQTGTVPACKRVAGSLGLHRPISWHCLRRKYYDYVKTGDWRVVVDWTRVPKHARPGGAVANGGQSGTDLPHDFLEYLKGLMSSNQRKSQPAIRALFRAWRRGDSIPGYGPWQEWFQAEHPHEPLPHRCPPDRPRGWSPGNLRRYIPQDAELALQRDGIAAARGHLPDILMTREGLRPLEYVMFDDVRTDFKILVPGYASPVQLNLLVALDVATGRVLRYGMRPAIEREDGTKEKLKLRDMKCLVAGMVAQYGVPRAYVMNLIVENATATIRDAFAMALAQVSCQQIAVHKTEMICGTAIWGGYKDRAGGNPGGKAPLESIFNLFHNEAGFEPGQIGRRYDQGPAELHGRTAEAVALARTDRYLSPHQRAALKRPFLNYAQARVVITDMWNRINARTDHDLEAFDVIGEFRLKKFDQWRHESELETLDPSLRSEVLWQNPPRKESPIERWNRLCAVGTISTSSLTSPSPFSKLHPGALARLYDEHKTVTILDGEIVFKFDKEQCVYRISNAVGRADRSDALRSTLRRPVTALAWFDPQDLSIIYLTDADGGFLGAIPRTRGLQRTDRDGLKAAYQQKRDALHDLQQRVSDRLPEQNEQRLADLDHNTQVLTDALADADAIDLAPTSDSESSSASASVDSVTSCSNPVPEFVSAIEQSKFTQAVAARQAAAESQRIQSAPRSLKSILAGYDALEADVAPDACQK